MVSANGKAARLSPRLRRAGERRKRKGPAHVWSRTPALRLQACMVPRPRSDPLEFGPVVFRDGRVAGRAERTARTGPWGGALDGRGRSLLRRGALAHLEARHEAEQL